MSPFVTAPFCRTLFCHVIPINEYFNDITAIDIVINTNVLSLKNLAMNITYETYANLGDGKIMELTNLI